eukprot:s117_g45.t1
MQGPPGPPNKKGRPFGHGTTSQARKERRAHLQWSALEGADPQSPATYVKHLAALEKATAKCREKLELSLSDSLEKLHVEVKKGGGRGRVVVVDWFNTLWVGQGVPPENLAGLEKLRQAAHVSILSYVGTHNSTLEVTRDMEEHLPDHLQQICTMDVCWRKVGRDGKCHLACDWGAVAIFDDCASIIRECQEWGLETYPINTLQEAMLRLVVGMKPLLKQWRHTSRTTSRAWPRCLEKHILQRGLEKPPAQ